MQCSSSRLAGRRASVGGGLVPLGLAVLLLAVPACGVPREQARRPRDYDLASVLHLRRAAEALQDRALEEREHVEALNAQLLRLRADEDRVHAAYLAAERDYHLRQLDLAGVETDLLVVDEELAARREELAALEAEREAVEARLAALRAELVQAERELEELRARVNEVLDFSARLRLVLAGGSDAELLELLARLPRPAPREGAPGTAGPPRAPAATSDPPPGSEVPPEAASDAESAESAESGAGTDPEG